MIDSSDHNLTCRAARRSYDVCKTMREKLNSAFQIQDAVPAGRGEWDHVFVRKIHTWVINASCASEAKHIRKQSWSCQARWTFHAEKHCELTRKWEYTGWNEATVTPESENTLDFLMKFSRSFLSLWFIVYNCFWEFSACSLVIQWYTFPEKFCYFRIDQSLSPNKQKHKRDDDKWLTLWPARSWAKTCHHGLVPEVGWTGPRATFWDTPTILYVS